MIGNIDVALPLVGGYFSLFPYRGQPQAVISFITVYMRQSR